MRADAPTMRRLRIGGAWLVAAAIAALVAHDMALGRRVAALEAAMAARDTADPLMPKECTIDMRGGGEPRGRTRDKPCQVEFHRVIQSPQQFEGRWVEVRGIHVEGFETSALFSPDWKGSEQPLEEPHAEALWTGVPLRREPTGDRVVAIGRFHRGPSGHMWSYFGELSNE